MSKSFSFQGAECLTTKNKNIKFLPVLFLLIAGLAIAAGKLIGTFTVASAIGYGTATYASDADNEYPAATRIYTQYMLPLFTAQSPLFFKTAAYGQNKASKDGDFMRITYADGTISDFTFNPITVGIPIKFSKIIASPNAQHAVISTAVSDASCGGATVSIPTGYYGSDSEVADDGSIVITGYYVDTGNFTYTIPAGRNVNCY